MESTTERDHIRDTTVYNKNERGHYGSLQAGIVDIHRPTENLNSFKRSCNYVNTLVAKPIKKNKSVFIKL